jgi:hypothetical protein
MRRAQPPDFSKKNVACHALRIGVCELEGSLDQRITTTTNQICSGSSGSGSRTGASGFSIGEGGSLIGGGIGSAGVRRRKGGSVGIPNFVSSCMAVRCQVGFKGSRTPNAALRTSDHPAEVLLALSLQDFKINTWHRRSILKAIPDLASARSQVWTPRRRTVSADRRRV